MDGPSGAGPQVRGVGDSSSSSVEKIHGLLDGLVQEQDRVVRELKQENKRLRQQLLVASRNPSVNLTATPGSDVVAFPVRDSCRQHSLMSTTLPIPVQVISRVLTDGSSSVKSSPRRQTVGSAPDGSSVLGVGILTPRSPPGAVEDDLAALKIFEDAGRLAAAERRAHGKEAPVWSPKDGPVFSPAPAPQRAPLPKQSLPPLPSSSYSWVSGVSNITSHARWRDKGARTASQATFESQPGLLSSCTQDAIRKLARVTDGDGHHSRADQFEQELKTRHMGILGLIFKHRLSVDAEQIESVSPLRAKVLMLLSWWVFDAVIGFLIVANAITIGIETSLVAQGHGIPLGLEILEAMFLAVFFTELCMRFYAVGARVLLSHWGKFDAVLVLCGLFDVLVKVTGSNSVLDHFMLVRMFRLMRLARAARLVVQFRTLWLLVQGLLLSCLPMLYTFGILCSLVYVFAVFGMEIMPITAEHGPEYEAVVAEHFSSIGDAMLILVQFIFLDSIGPVLRTLVKARPELCVYFFSFILLGSISLMNLVTAIMVESSIRQASEDQEARKAWEGMKRRQMAPKLRAMFKALDSDSSGAVSLEDIIVSPSELQQQLLYMCNMDDLRETFEMLDYDNSGLVDVDEFVNGIMRVQADKPAELIRLVKQCSDILKNVASLERRLQELDGKPVEVVRSSRVSLRK